MTGSQPAPKMLALQALITFDEAILLVDQIHGLPEGPDKTQMFAALRDGLLRYRPVLRGVISAQHQAAEALNLSQNPAVRVLASIGVAAEHAHSANDKPHSPAPHQPSDGVA